MPCPQVPVLIWKRIFFVSVVAFRQHVNGIFGYKNGGFGKRSRILGKRRLTVFRWTDKNGRFRILWRHRSNPVCLRPSMLCNYKGSYCIFIFSNVYVWTGETTRIRYVLTRSVFFKKGGRKWPLSKISGYLWTGPMVFYRCVMLFKFGAIYNLSLFYSLILSLKVKTEISNFCHQ